MDSPRTELKPQTPKIIILEVPKSTIGGIIGPGGKVIQELQKKQKQLFPLRKLMKKAGLKF